MFAIDVRFVCFGGASLFAIAGICLLCVTCLRSRLFIWVVLAGFLFGSLLRAFAGCKSELFGGLTFFWRETFVVCCRCVLGLFCGGEIFKFVLICAFWVAFKFVVTVC